jgi:hypothetical protein
MMSMSDASEPDQLIPVDGWPEPTTSTELRVLCEDFALTLLYRAHAGGWVVLHFPWCQHLILGEPNDEALAGHSLSRRGLRPYSIYEVRSSTLIARLERQNAVHPCHSPVWYLAGRKHFVFTFKEKTLECVVSETERFRPSVERFESHEAALLRLADRTANL